MNLLYLVRKVSSSLLWCTTVLTVMAGNGVMVIRVVHYLNKSPYAWFLIYHYFLFEIRSVRRYVFLSERLVLVWFLVDITLSPGSRLVDKRVLKRGNILTEWRRVFVPTDHVSVISVSHYPSWRHLACLFHRALSAQQTLYLQRERAQRTHTFVAFRYTRRYP